MKTYSRTKWLAITLLVLAICMGLWQLSHISDHDRLIHHNQKPANLNHSEKTGSSQAGADPLVEVSGLGKLPYKNVEKQKDLNDIMNRCGILTDYERRVENGYKSPIDAYTNEKGEIVHLSFQKGKYKTKSRASEFISDLESYNVEGEEVFRIVSHGVPDLTLDPSERLKNFLKLSRITVATSEEIQCEIEVTPVVAEVMPNSQCDSKYIGKKYPMILTKIMSGHPPAYEVVLYSDYLRTEMIVTEWILEPFLPDPDDPNGLMPKVGNGGYYVEPLLEAWEVREAKKLKEHPPIRK